MRRKCGVLLEVGMYVLYSTRLVPYGCNCTGLMVSYTLKKVFFKNL